MVEKEVKGHGLVRNQGMDAWGDKHLDTSEGRGTMANDGGSILRVGVGTNKGDVRS